MYAIRSYYVYLKSAAVFKIATYLKFPLSGFRYLKIIPLVVSDFLYDVVARITSYNVCYTKLLR